MYLWNYEKLAEDFVRGKISERVKFLYYLLPMILSALGVSVFYLIFPEYKAISTSVYGAYDIASSVLMAVILSWIIYNLFKINERADNKDFLPRLFAFQFITGIRLTVYLLGFGLVMGILTSLATVIKDPMLEIVSASMYLMFIGFFATIVYGFYKFVKAFLYIRYFDAVINKKISFVAAAGKGAITTKKKVSITGGKIKSKPVAKAKKRK